MMVPYCDVGSFVRSLVGSFVLFALRFALDVRDLLPPLLFSLSSLLADVFMSESLVLQNEIPKFCKTRTTTLKKCRILRVSASFAKLRAKRDDNIM